MDLNLDVLPFTDDDFANALKHLSKTPLTTVFSKKQTSYFLDYLRNVGVQSFIVEPNYVDRSYLEDYSQYYVRCFEDYPKRCARLHFFKIPSEEFSIDDFKAIVSGESFTCRINDKELIVSHENINDFYSGFLVVKPIPNTLFGRSCLTLALPSNTVSAELRNYPVNLYGLELNVKTIAYQEQDKVVAACATSSLWCLLNSSKSFSLQSIPSPSSITSDASDTSSDRGRKFPSEGLSAEMMVDYLSKVGFEPMCCSLELPLQKAGSYIQHANELKKKGDDKHAEYFKAGVETETEAYKQLYEYVYSYTKGGLPSILTSDVFERKLNLAEEDDNAFKHVGKHATTVTACSIKKGETGLRNFGFNLKSHRVDKIYVHDDRIGPFVPISLVKEHESFELYDEQQGSATQLEGFFTSSLSYSINLVDQYKSNVEVKTLPSALMYGLYHKIRIPYVTIRNTCYMVNDFINKAVQGTTTNRLQKAFYPNESLCYEWDIWLCESSTIKQSYQKEAIPREQKVDILTRSLPKYIWVARAAYDDQAYFDLIFDATDIGQGDVFVTALFFNTESEPEIKTFLKDLLEVYSKPDEAELFEAVNGLYRWLNGEKPHISLLDNTYGKLLFPARIKPHEVEGDEIAEPHSLGVLFKPVNLALKDDEYIWVIDQNGYIHIGKDIPAGHGDDGKPIYKGHPTLINAAPGRIAGELTFVNEGISKITNKSGRYAFKGDSESREERHLENAGELFKALLLDLNSELEVEYLDW